MISFGRCSVAGLGGAAAIASVPPRRCRLGPSLSRSHLRRRPSPVTAASAPEPRADLAASERHSASRCATATETIPSCNSAAVPRPSSLRPHPNPSLGPAWQPPSEPPHAVDRENRSKKSSNRLDQCGQRLGLGWTWVGPSPDPRQI